MGPPIAGYDGLAACMWLDRFEGRWYERRWFGEKVTLEGMGRQPGVRTGVASLLQDGPPLRSCRTCVSLPATHLCASSVSVGQAGHVLRELGASDGLLEEADQRLVGSLCDGTVKEVVAVRRRFWARTKPPRVSAAVRRTTQLV